MIEIENVNEMENADDEAFVDSIKIAIWLSETTGQKVKPWKVREDIRIKRLPGHRIKGQGKNSKHLSKMKDVRKYRQEWWMPTPI